MIQTKLNPLVDSFHEGTWLKALLSDIWDIQIDASNHYIDNEDLKEQLMMDDNHFFEKYSNTHFIDNKGLDNKLKKFGLNPKAFKAKNIKIVTIGTFDMIADALTKSAMKSSVQNVVKTIDLNFPFNLVKSFQPQGYNFSLFFSHSFHTTCCQPDYYHHLTSDFSTTQNKNSIHPQDHQNLHSRLNLISTLLNNYLLFILNSFFSFLFLSLSIILFLSSYHIKLSGFLSLSSSLVLQYSSSTLSSYLSTFNICQLSFRQSPPQKGRQLFYKPVVTSTKLQVMAFGDFLGVAVELLLCYTLFTEWKSAHIASLFATIQFRFFYQWVSHPKRVGWAFSLWGRKSMDKTTPGRFQVHYIFMSQESYIFEISWFSIKILSSNSIHKNKHELITIFIEEINPSLHFCQVSKGKDMWYYNLTQLYPNSSHDQNRLGGWELVHSFFLNDEVKPAFHDMI
ncbi:hypothetical protein VP01_3000g2 [Puccinia sorghi]|uniref:Uncharacterized protein n=1 Tax=Puccinia sorghi TaxID=27349 RepID=A0A0L6V244_9BASI|nr:hypothetical protein VP01_3000g2 [Puccinia sorghi]